MLSAKDSTNMAIRQQPKLVDGFSADSITLIEILEKINSGEIKLPNFQRNWRWTDEHIQKLLETVAEGQPVGSIMLLETGGEARFDHRPVEGCHTDAEHNMSPTRLLMDGQQRLTSLYQALFSPNDVVMDNGNKEPKRKKYFIDIEKSLNTSIPLIESIISVDIDPNGRVIKNRNSSLVGLNINNIDVQIEKMILPFNKILSFSVWEEHFYANFDNLSQNGNLSQEQYIEKNRKTTQMRLFRRSIIDIITGYRIPYILLKKEMSVGNVCRVYEKLNSTGVSLDGFDLLIAQFAAKGQNLRNDWYGNSGIDAKIGIYEIMTSGVGSDSLLNMISPRYFMQTVNIISIEGDPSRVSNYGRLDLLGLTPEKYNLYKDVTIQSFKKTAKFLYQNCVRKGRTAPSPSIISVITMIVALIDRNFERADVRRRLDQVLWRLMYANKSSAGDIFTNIAPNILREITNWVLNGENYPNTLKNYILVDSQISFSSKKNSSLHNVVNLCIIRMNALDFMDCKNILGHMDSDANYDVHHIFPVKWCQNNGISKERYDSVVNKTPMSSETNKIIGSIAPSLYIEKLMTRNGKTNEEMDQALRSHGISPEHIRNNNFEEFFKERLEFLISAIETDMGVRVARSTDLTQPDEDWPEEADLRLKTKYCTVYARISDQGIVLLKDSTFPFETAPSFSENTKNIRDSLIQQSCKQKTETGEYILTENALIGQPTTAASVVSGSNSNMERWKNRKDESLTIEFFNEMKESRMEHEEN